MAENTVYHWKSKCGGLEVSEAEQLRQLEQANSRLKKLLPKVELDKAALKALVEGNR